MYCVPSFLDAAIFSRCFVSFLAMLLEAWFGPGGLDNWTMLRNFAFSATER